MPAAYSQDYSVITSSFSNILGVTPKSNVSFELVKSTKLCSTSTNPKMFGTSEEKTNIVLEIRRSLETIVINLLLW